MPLPQVPYWRGVQLLVADVKLEGGIHFLDLRETDDAGNTVKTMKTGASRRPVPLHPEIMKAGFLAFVEAQRAEGGAFLFPSLKPNKLGAKSDPIGKWFQRTRKEIVGELPNIQGAKAMHSFRQGVRRALPDAEIRVDVPRQSEAGRARTARVLKLTTGAGSA